MHYSLQCISLICWAYFSDILVSTVFRKLLWIRHSADHKTVTMTFFGASLALGSVLGWLCQYHHWVSHRLLHTVHFSSPITIWSRNKSVSLHRIRDDTSKQWFLLFPVNLSSFFYLCNLLQIPNNHRTIHIEAFSKLCSCRRISFTDCSQLGIVSFWWPTTAHFIFKALVSLARLLEVQLHCTSIHSWAK